MEHIPHFKSTLNNGLRVLIHHAPQNRQAIFSITYNVGSSNETPNRTGMAHLLEHLMFEGTPSFPHFDTIVQKAGGSSNAFTSPDITCYYESLPAENLEVACELEADRMSHATLDDQKIEIQKKVVLEEFKERYINNPYGDVWHLLRSLCFESTPYEWPVIGRTPEEVQSLTPEEIRHFHRKFYHPGNSIIVVACPQKPENILPTIVKYFNHIQPSETLSDGPTQIQKDDTIGNPRFKHVNRKVPDSVIYLCWRTRASTEIPSQLGYIMAEWLGGSETSPLHEILVRNKKILTSVQAYHLEGALDGLFVISGRLNEGVLFQAVREEILKIIRNFRTGHVEVSRLKRIKNLLQTSRHFELTQAYQKVQRLLWFELIWGDAALESEYEERLENTSSEQIFRFAYEYLSPEKLYELWYEKENL